MTCMQCKHITECEDDAFINGAKFDPNESAKYCTGFERITNADRIRSMSDEELAKNLVYVMCAYCYEHRTEKCYRKCADNMLEWLKQPAE